MMIKKFLELQYLPLNWMKTMQYIVIGQKITRLRMLA